MRHGKKIKHLGRTAAHRKAMLANMGASLIEHKRIKTTVSKAKALKQYIEPLITKSKEDNTHNRRIVFSYLRNKYAVAELFREVVDKVGDRPGGYTRIIRTGNRLGDNAEMCIIELVDFNELYTNEKAKKSKSRRSRRGGKKKSAETGDHSSEAQAAAKPVAAEPSKSEAAEVPAEAPSAEAEQAQESAPEEQQSAEAQDQKAELEQKPEEADGEEGKEKES